jgi:hypothetical protein
MLEPFVELPALRKAIGETFAMLIFTVVREAVNLVRKPSFSDFPFHRYAPPTNADTLSKEKLTM